MWADVFKFHQELFGMMEDFFLLVLI